MSKIFLFLSLVALVTCSSAFAESITCQPQDLKVSLSRAQRKTSPISYPEYSVLTVICKGHDPLLLKTSSPFTPSVDLDPSPLSNSNFHFFSNQFFSGLEDQHVESVMKSFLATLLTAKTSGLTVTITYDQKNGFNYTDGKAILGVAIEWRSERNSMQLNAAVIRTTES